MASINQKLTTIEEALLSLQKAITLFNKYKEIIQKQPTEPENELFLATRDSMIQRFEYCTDLFWKLLKIYLEDIEKITLSAVSPRGIIRDSTQNRIITEKEGEQLMEMIKNRNATSHIYHKEVAESIAQKIPQFYELMNVIEKRIKEKTKDKI